MTVHDPVLDYLNIQSITEEYLNADINDIPFIHYTVTKYTQSANVLYKYPVKNTEKDAKIDHDEIKYIPRYNGNASDELKIRLYVMQFKLELIMHEFTLASGTIQRLKDLFSMLKIDEKIGPLTQIILLRSELLEVEACYNLSFTNIKTIKTDEKSILDKLADIKQTVTSYIDKSSEIILNSYNKSIALSISSSGSESMRSPIDLYSIQKRKCQVDIDIVNLACSIEIDSTKKVALNPNLAINESINALNELLILRPLDIEVHLKLAYIYLNEGLFKMSLFHISESLLCGGSNAYNIWALRGEVCYLQSNEKLNDSLDSIKSWVIISISSFLYSIELNENYLRSWIGLHISLNKLMSLNTDIDDIYNNINNIKNKKIEKFIQFKNTLSIKDKQNLNWVLDKFPL